MFYQDFTTWSSLGKTFFEPLYDAQKITMPFLEKLQRENIATFSDNIAFGIEYVQSINKVTKLEDLAKAQIIYFTKAGEKNMQHGQNYLKIMEEGFKDFRQAAKEKMSEIFSEEEGHSKSKKTVQ